MSVQIEKRLLTVAEYHKMADAGILTENDRVELINGEIITMSPINSLHAGHINRISALLHRLLGDRAIVAVQNPITILGHSEPEPDIALLRFREDYYTDSHPTPEDVHLIIEVAISSLRYDRTIKLPLYASAGIPECWIVNLDDDPEQVEVCRQPGLPRELGGRYGYGSKEIIRAGDELVLTAFDLTISAEDLLG